MAIGFIAIVAVSYLVVANVLLSTRLLRNAVSGSSLNFAIRGNSTALLLDYDSAYSIFPGRVHVEGLRIRGRERTLEWLLTLDRADASISLVDLLRRRFHATRVSSSGFAIRLRLRLDRATATPGVIDALPPIAGFADPPLLDGGPEPPLLTDQNYDLWTVELEDVDVEHVREVWIQTWRSRGDTHVRGRLLFRPQRGLEVGPATVDANGVDFFYGKHVLATGLRGSVGAALHPFDLRRAKGLAVFDHVSYRGHLRGRAIIAAVLRLAAPRSGVDFKRCEGPVDARIVLDHGKLAHGTRVLTEAADCEVATEGLILRAPIHTMVAVDRGLGTIETRVSDLRVSRFGVEQARATAIVATVKSRRLELARAFGDAHFTLEVAGAETNDIGAWTRFVPWASSFVTRSGKVTADVHADGSLVEGGVRATGAVAADDLTVRLGRGILVGTLAAHVELRRGTWNTRAFDFSGSSVALRTVSASSRTGDATIFTVPSLTAVAPRLVLAPSGLDGLVSVDLPRADLVDLGALRELLPLPSGLRIDGGKGEAKFHGDIELPSGSVRGDGEVFVRGIRARLGSTKLFGDLACRSKARRTQGPGGSTDFSGSSLALTRAGTGNAVSPGGAWWGNLVLRDAILRTNGGVRFDAKAHLSAKDAAPATVLVSQNTDVPSWATNVFQMPALDADAQVRILPRVFEVRSLVARGGGSSVRAEYTKRHGRQDGAVLLDLGFIDMGYDLADGATGLVLVGPESWFERKKAVMQNAAGSGKHGTDGAEQRARYVAMTPGLRKDEATALAARCTLEQRSCDGTSIENLLLTAADTDERDTLSGITYAPMLVAAAKEGTDGTTLDPLVIGSSAEALRLGSESTLDNIPSMTRVAAASDSAAARGKVIAVSGRVSPIRREGSYSVGTLTTDAEPVYFVTPFATDGVADTLARFRGVFVQRYRFETTLGGVPPSLVLVGAFAP